jgi:hypothetical protein
LIFRFIHTTSCSIFFVSIFKFANFFSVRRSEPPISPRHHASITSNNRSTETLQNLSTPTPLSSTITLRDSSIREQPILKDSTYFRGSSYTSNNSSGFNSSIYSSRERDCGSPFRNSSGLIPSSVLQYSGVAPTRENNSKVAPNRLLTSGIDQRILKQSTEDCRRLLQQVSC